MTIPQSSNHPPPPPHNGGAYAHVQQGMVAPAPAAPATMPLPTVAPGPPPMIIMDHVTKRIGEKTLVQDLTFDIGQGEIFGFIGPSGSGKTSTIRLMTGTYSPTEGNVRVM